MNSFAVSFNFVQLNVVLPFVIMLNAVTPFADTK